jgi:hypothetical protein
MLQHIDDEHAAMLKDVNDKLEEVLSTRINIPATVTLEQLIDVLASRSMYLGVVRVKEGDNHDKVMFALTQMNDDEFATVYLNNNQHRLSDLADLDLAPEHRTIILMKSDDEYKALHAHRCTEMAPHLFLLLPLSPHSTLPPSLQLTQLDEEFMTSAIYQAQQTVPIINQCKTNFAAWGQDNQERWIQIDFINIDKMMNRPYTPYAALVDMLYLNPAKAVGTRQNKHTHPNHPSLTATSSATFPLCYKPLLDDGTIPQLSPNLKLFFSHHISTTVSGFNFMVLAQASLHWVDRIST